MMMTIRSSLKMQRLLVRNASRRARARAKLAMHPLPPCRSPTRPLQRTMPPPRQPTANGFPPSPTSPAPSALVRPLPSPSPRAAMLSAHRVCTPPLSPVRHSRLHQPAQQERDEEEEEGRGRWGRRRGCSIRRRAREGGDARHAVGMQDEPPPMRRKTRTTKAIRSSTSTARCAGRPCTAGGGRVCADSYCGWRR